MSAFDDEFHVLERNRWKHMVRDVRLLVWLSKFVLFYAIVGGRIRREYVRKRAVGEIYWLD